ncbi:hypothetical protein [Salinispora arenicola]|uniref:hypothetical protein n=1 Tax=Salinispora arenicola TaxID=168697 RepID=UPI0003615B28|nr:hypothetical protein [Salinispora arenicola]
MSDLHQAITEQIRDEVAAVALALEALIGPDCPRVSERVQDRAPMWAAQLLDEDDRLAAQTVIDLMNVLPPPTADWWGSPLGQAVARSVGHPDADHVSYSVAGAMLGVSKQAVAKMVGTGRLSRGSDGGVTTASIQHLLRQREPSNGKGPR